MAKVTGKTLKYRSDVQERDGIHANIYFVLQVHIYKGHMFEYPTKINIRSCAYETNPTEIEKPYSLPSLDSPYITRDPCECQETPSSTVSSDSIFLKKSN